MPATNGSYSYTETKNGKIMLNSVDHYDLIVALIEYGVLC